ncbi:Uncharacterised protein [Mycobacteroides abscessus]|nr:Uncharacterised protein [Mycobacteroides abscessus]
MRVRDEGGTHRHRAGESDPEQRVLHREDMPAQSVVDVGLHTDIGAQLDHLPSHAEAECGGQQDGDVQT